MNVTPGSQRSQRSQRKQLNKKTFFDTAPYLVCSEPNIWVFDDLLPENFLTHIDKIFDSGDVDIEKVPDKRDHFKFVRMVTLERGKNNGSSALLDTFAKISHVTEIEKCRYVVVSEIWGENQDCHMDHADIDNLAPAYQKLGFLNLNRFNRFCFDKSKVIPTFSFVVNINDVGSIVFPNAALTDKTIPAKRGRIVMFQNYIESQRPITNTLCHHYGTYSTEKAKRVITAGVLSNHTPDLRLSTSEPAVIYILNWQSDHTDYLPRPKFNPKAKVLAKSKYGCLDAIISWSNSDELYWENGQSYKKLGGGRDKAEVIYKVSFTENLLNNYLGIEGNKNISQKDLIQSCGNINDEMVVFFVLSVIVGAPKSLAKGWICTCHLCHAKQPTHQSRFRQRSHSNGPDPLDFQPKPLVDQSRQSRDFYAYMQRENQQILLQKLLWDELYCNEPTKNSIKKLTANIKVNTTTHIKANTTENIKANKVLIQTSNKSNTRKKTTPQKKNTQT